MWDASYNMGIPRERSQEMWENLSLLYPVCGLARDEGGEESANGKIVDLAELAGLNQYRAWHGGQELKDEGHKDRLSHA